MIVLGYTGKFYARWEMTTEITNVMNDRYTENIKCTYIRKVADTLENSIKKFPELTVETILNGHKRSFSISHVIFTSNETFRFGKYNGKRIEDINEGSYIAWYMNLDNGYLSDEHKAYCRKCLIKYFKYTEENGVLVSPEIRKTIDNKKQVLESVINKARHNKHVYLELKHWPNENGEVEVDDVVYKFPEVRKYYYNGYPYYMPVLNNVAKRIKNHVIKATLSYIFDTIYIDDFKIVMK